MRDNSVEYTLTTPAGAYAVTRAANQITRLKDIAFSAAIRTRSYDLANQHGKRILNSYKSGGLLDITLQTRPGNGTAAQLEADRSQLIACLNSLMDDQGSLSWTNTGSVTPITLGNLTLPQDPKTVIQAGGWMWNIQLESEKPFAEDATATVTDTVALTDTGGGWSIPLTLPVTILPSSGGTMTLTHNGDFPRAYPLIRVFGPIADPMLTNQTTGERIVFSGSIADGDYWDIDLWDRSVTLNGLYTIRALNTAASTWWSCRRGSNIIQLSGAAFASATKARAYMKSSWG